MDNIIFNDIIEVSITKSPDYPIEGDDIVFTANVRIANTSDYSIPDNYFLSYTWMESQDGGATYYRVGQDLETLTISNISKAFFNNLYKVQVGLVNFENIILTEDGDNLTTQFGEILIGNNSSLNMSVQSANDNVLSDVPAISADTSITALDIVNLNSVIDEALSYDTTLNDINQAIVAGGQITIDKNNNAQILNGENLQQATLNELPDLQIETPTSGLSIQANDRYTNRSVKKILACGTINYKECVQDNGGEFESKEQCTGCNGSGQIVCKSLNSNINDDGTANPDPIRPIKLGVAVATINNYRKESTNNDVTVSEPLCCTPHEELCSGGENTDCINQGKCLDKDSYFGLVPPAGIEEKDKLAWIKNQDNSMIKYIEVGTVEEKPHPRGGRSGGIVKKEDAIAEANRRAKSRSCLCEQGGSYCDIIDSGNSVPVTGTGKTWWKFKCMCPKKYYKKRIQCGKEVIALEKSQEILPIETYSPSYSCRCVSNNPKDGRSGLVGNIVVSPPNDGALIGANGAPCEYYVTRQCASPNSSCECTADNASSAPFGSSIRPYSFTTPKAGELDENIQYPDLASCYDPTGCLSTCVGLDCCNSPTPKTIWDKPSPSSQNVKCNREDTIYGQYIGICNAESESEYPVYKYTISQRFRKCDEKADNRNTFDSLSDAEATITDPAVIQYNKLINDRDKQKELKDKIPKLQTLSRYTKDEQTYGPLNLDKRCTSCQVIYKVTSSPGNVYPCRDTTSNPNVNCGLYNQCNVDSDNTSLITIATITKVEPTTAEIIAKAKNGTDGYYDDLGKAIAFAKGVANPGIVLSSPCPD
jgi:hypothetical protein